MSGPTPATVFSFLRSQMCFHPPLPTSSFQGQTAIVTGANTGLGRETAKHLVRLGATRVILAVRTLAKGDDAREYVEQETGRKAVMEVWHLDMAIFDSVREFAKRAGSLERLDVVVANAGIWPTKFELVENHEATITVNVLSTFLLVNLILPSLYRTATQTGSVPRLTVVTSALHAFATLPARKQTGPILAALDDDSLKDFDGRYNDSKLLVHLYGSRLAATMAQDSEKPSVCLTFVAPGWCMSNLHPYDGFMGRMSQKVIPRSTDEGARCIVDAVAAEKVGGRHGAYLDDMKVKSPAHWLDTRDGKETGERVWKEVNAVLTQFMGISQAE